MTLKPILCASEAQANFAELQQPLTASQARIEASRCLNCFDAPCIHACPTGIDVPSFIGRIAEGRELAAAKLIGEANLLGASCARVCPTQVLCEGACVLKDRDEKPIEIGRLQRHATDAASAAGLRVLGRAAPATGKRVAVIGGGPAGLSCAADLARLGHAVTIVERHAQLGGLNTYGIARYKLTMEDSLEEIRHIKELGIAFRMGVEIGSAAEGQALLKEFDAVFVAIGLGTGNALGIEGESLPGVMDALSFIREVHERPLHEISVGERVVVIGGGNTAIDAATQSARLGAQVTIVYRRTEGDMSAYDFERAIARQDGVRFMFDAVPVAFVAREGRLCAVRIAGLATDIPCDMVLKAIGQSKRADWLARVFPVRDRVFVGGDFANGGREVVNAIGEGRNAAFAIHAALGGSGALPPLQPSRLGMPEPRGAGLVKPVRPHEAERVWRSAPRG